MHFSTLSVLAALPYLAMSAAIENTLTKRQFLNCGDKFDHIVMMFGNCARTARIAAESASGGKDSIRFKNFFQDESLRKQVAKKFTQVAEECDAVAAVNSANNVYCPQLDEDDRCDDPSKKIGAYMVKETGAMTICPRFFDLPTIDDEHIPDNVDACEAGDLQGSVLLHEETHNAKITEKTDDAIYGGARNIIDHPTSPEVRVKTAAVYQYYADAVRFKCWDDKLV